MEEPKYDVIFSVVIQCADCGLRGFKISIRVRKILYGKRLNTGTQGPLKRCEPIFCDGSRLEDLEMINNDNIITFMDAMLYAMEGENPSKAIENQEKRGQQSVVRNQRLPKKLNDMSLPREVGWNCVDDSMELKERSRIVKQNNIEYTRQQYERMGITIVEEYDDLFWSVVLPEGWKIEATDHSMWNNLFDDKGRKRANFFYKAAFYDRDAFINFDTRYHVTVDHVADASSGYEVWKNSDYQGTVKDGEEIIFSTGCVPATGSYDGDNDVKNTLRVQLDKYMAENYPNYEDINAYWD